MLKASPENCPVKEVKGRLKVVRQRVMPQKKPKAGWRWLEELGLSEQLVLFICLTILGALLAPGVLFCGLPANRLWFDAYRLKPTPPGAKEFFWPGLLVAFFPGLFGAFGLVSWLLFMIGQYVDWLGFLSRYLIADSWQLCMGVVPAYLFYFAYLAWRYQCERKAITTYLKVLEEAGLEERAELTSEKEATLARQEELNSGHAMRLGEFYRRHWEPKAARWRFDLLDGKELCYLTREHLCRHLLVVAPTRAGKTYNLIRPVLEECHRANYALILLDTKGYEFDPDLFEASFSLQPQEAGTSLRLCLIDPLMPPLKATQRLAEALIKENPEQPFFSDSSRLALVAFMLAHRVVYNQFPELSRVLDYTAYKENRTRLSLKLEEIQEGQNNNLGQRGNKGGNRKSEAHEALQFLVVAEQRASNSRSDSLGSLYNALLPLATGQYRQYVTTNPKYGLTIRELLNRRLRVRFAFTADEGELGSALGKIVVQQYTEAVLSPVIDRHYLKLLVLDEAQHYLCEALKRGVAQAAGNLAGYVLAFQSMRQIPDENTRSIIFGNCKNRFVLSGAEYSDAEMFSREFGEEELEFYSTGMSRGESTGESEQKSNAYSTGWNSGSSSGASVSSITSGSSSGESNTTSTGTTTGRNSNNSEQKTYHRRPLWLPREIAQIPRFHAVAVLDDGKCQTQPQMASFNYRSYGLKGSYLSSNHRQSPLIGEEFFVRFTPDWPDIPDHEPEPKTEKDTRTGSEPPVGLPETGAKSTIATSQAENGENEAQTPEKSATPEIQKEEGDEDWLLL